MPVSQRDLRYAPKQYDKSIQVGEVRYVYVAQTVHALVYILNRMIGIEAGSVVETHLDISLGLFHIREIRDIPVPFRTRSIEFQPCGCL